MVRKAIVVFVATLLAFAAGYCVALRVSDSGHILPREVVAGGGNRSTTSSGHALYSTIGQPATNLMSAGNGSILVGGFQTMQHSVSAAARRWSLY